MSVAETLKMVEDKMKKTLDVAHHELNNIRTGRASVSLVDEIKVDYYNTPTPLKQLATISAPQAHLIVIQPWDASVITEIAKAILRSNTGFTPSNDGKIIRISVPELTTEQRQEMVQIAKKVIEEAKIALRSIRREANDVIDKEKKESVLSEDEAFKGHEEVQETIDNYVAKAEELFEGKEKEIMEF